VELSFADCGGSCGPTGPTSQGVTYLFCNLCLPFPIEIYEHHSSRAWVSLHLHSFLSIYLTDYVSNGASCQQTYLSNPHLRNRVLPPTSEQQEQSNPLTQLSAMGVCLSCLGLSQQSSDVSDSCRYVSRDPFAYWVPQPPCSPNAPTSSIRTTPTILRDMDTEARVKH
jgi:hypothetical protein